MTRPLIITDCDEVLLHMVVPFRAWLDDTHDVHFDIRGQEFTDALRHKESGLPLERALVWKLLIEFFQTAMDRQYPIAGAFEALSRLSAVADIVVLTNIGEMQHQARIEHLRGYGVEHPIFWNQGPKGAPLAAIVADRKPSVALFIDDLGFHHQSVAECAPDVWRLHMVGEPEISADVPPAAAAHARIDDWVLAEQWILDRIEEGPAKAA